MTDTVKNCCDCDDGMVIVPYHANIFGEICEFDGLVKCDCLCHQPKGEANAD